MGNAKTKLDLLLGSISDMISDATNCQTELYHIKTHHLQNSINDLTAQFTLAHRLRHIQNLEQRLNGYLVKLHNHHNQVKALLDSQTK